MTATLKEFYTLAEAAEVLTACGRITGMADLIRFFADNPDQKDLSLCTRFDGEVFDFGASDVHTVPAEGNHLDRCTAYVRVPCGNLSPDSETVTLHKFAPLLMVEWLGFDDRTETHAFAARATIPRHIGDALGNDVIERHSLTVHVSEVLVTANSLMRLTHPEKAMGQDWQDGSLPDDLALAYQVHRKFWEGVDVNDRSQYPEPKAMEQFVRDRVRGIEAAKLDRILSVARPDEAKAGGRPRKK